MTTFWIFGDINMNVIDGSAIWLQSTALTLGSLDGIHPRLVLKAPIVRRLLVEPMLADDRVNVIDPLEADWISPEEGTISPFKARTLIAENSASNDQVLLRGSRVVSTFLDSDDFRSRLWIYLTDIPHLVSSFDRESVALLHRAADHGAQILCQTEPLRDMIEETVPALTGRCWLLPPTIPTDPTVRPHALGKHLSLVYAGKFAPDWMTLEMCRLPGALVRPTSLTLVGDKIQGHPEYRQSMAEALKAPGVRWLGAMTRDATLAELANHDIGLSWRSPAMSESREISTKILEYCSRGVPPLVNPSPLHFDLLGKDYPLFAETFDQLVEVLDRYASKRSLQDLARARASGAGENFSPRRSAERMSTAIQRAIPDQFDPATDLTVLSHDYKFLDPILERLERRDSVHNTRDIWKSLDSYDLATTKSMLARAEVILCEWCGPNAVLASNRINPSQRLLIRLHRFEVDRRWPLEVDIDRVERVVVVSPYFRQLVAERFKWPLDKIVAIPNPLDHAQLQRQKLDNARFNIAMIGVVPTELKGLDKALDILAHLRDEEPRFHLFIRSKRPWEVPFLWDRSEERRAALEIAQRVQTDERLIGAVSFDGFGADIPRWLRKSGQVWSLSEVESFHMGCAEGMASGAVPSILRWPAADSIFAPRWLNDDVTSVAEHTLSMTHIQNWRDASLAASVEMERFDWLQILPLWEALISGTLGDEWQASWSIR
ncbi:glycosyltransferase family 4 protein [soil metagenome]